MGILVHLSLCTQQKMFLQHTKNEELFFALPFPEGISFAWNHGITFLNALSRSNFSLLFLFCIHFSLESNEKAVQVFF